MSSPSAIVLFLHCLSPSSLIELFYTLYLGFATAPSLGAGLGIGYCNAHKVHSAALSRVSNVYSASSFHTLYLEFAYPSSLGLHLWILQQVWNTAVHTRSTPLPYPGSPISTSLALTSRGTRAFIYFSDECSPLYHTPSLTPFIPVMISINLRWIRQYPQDTLRSLNCAPDTYFVFSNVYSFKFLL